VTPPYHPMKNECTCNGCGDVIVWMSTPAGVYEHLCCRQLKPWADKFALEENINCVTDSDPFVAVTNMHAVRNLILLSWQINKENMIDEGHVLSDPPTNKNMRYGCYKGPFVYVVCK
jgi:hypothetical protein